jgi:hypothetical protein
MKQLEKTSKWILSEQQKREALSYGTRRRVGTNNERVNIEGKITRNISELLKYGSMWSISSYLGLNFLFPCVQITYKNIVTDITVSMSKGKSKSKVVPVLHYLRTMPLRRMREWMYRSTFS